MDHTIAIRAEHLSKTYGRGKKRVRAIESLDLDVQAGQIYGFLGPNGAGKTTTIRMLLGLVRPDQGTVALYGHPVQRHHDILQRVGAIVERASFYDFLSGQKNLEVLAHTSGCHDRSRIIALLNQVGLAGRARQPVGSYSTGMKQRLGLAAALLHDPDLLILDEPTGGLDPAGIHEVRQFLRDLVDRQGKTVFLSSHLLGEMEQICDRVAIIHRGRIAGEGRVANLLAGRSQVWIKASPPDLAADALRQAWTISRDGQGLRVHTRPEDAPCVVSHLVAQGIDVHQVTSSNQTLEEYFLQVTQGKK